MRIHRRQRNARASLGVLAALAVGMLIALGWWLAEGGPTAASPEPEAPATTSAPFVGSVSCRGCHEKFYELWADSHHGLAMQPYTAAFAEENLAPQRESLVIGERKYRARIGADEGFIEEKAAAGEARYPIVHVLGGKNVYYLLTPMERGRLQVLPVAYDVRRNEWFDTTASAVRHFTDRTDEALDWRDRPLTFNTSCYGCHVSQLSTNYDLGTDSYHTVWAEPGINCETCHGPGAEHVRVCREAPEGRPPDDIKIIRTAPFTAEQTNSMCAPCHAKMIPLTPSFMPGERYFDHYDLVTLEHPDFYPDGRDLGENYTFTLWRMSPCAKSGQLDCNHCHTSSGRYRFAGERTNEACLPCHEEHVTKSAEHSHHERGTEGDTCVACHMPMTEFARMRRSDHSMRPPTPLATIRYRSPNACNLCHKDKTPKWSDTWVRKWYPRDYQAPVLRWAQLVADGKKRDWSRLDAMLETIRDPEHDEVVATSLIRLLRACDEPRKWSAIVAALKDPSPMVRGAAAEVLGEYPHPASLEELFTATRDDFRLVRIRAAGALAGVPKEQVPRKAREDLRRATDEFITSMRARPDDPASHYNLGNFHMSRQDIRQAVAEFETATRLQPDFIAPLVNASIAYNMLGQNRKAEESLRRAIAVEPNSVAANLNLGLLLGEVGRTEDAARAFRKTLRVDPNCPVAAYNLSVLIAEEDTAEAIRLCERAARLRPDAPRYAYTLAFFHRQSGDADAAVRTLRDLIRRRPVYADAYLLLADIYEEQGKASDALDVYRRALEVDTLPEAARRHIAGRRRALEEG